LDQLIGKSGYFALDLFFLLVSLHCESEGSVNLWSNCQLAWIIAAILPLPKRPQFIDDPARMMACEESIGRVYLPNSSVVNIAEMDEKIYQKARWWRVLNRVMVAPACLIIGAVVSISGIMKTAINQLTIGQVALAIVATRVR